MNYLFGRGGATGGALRAAPARACSSTCCWRSGPSLATFVYSLTDTNGLTPEPLNFIGFDNYREFLFQGAAARQNIEALWPDDPLLRARHRHPVRDRVCWRPSCSTRSLRGTRLFRALFFLPVILGVTIQGLVWRLFLYPLGGPVDRCSALFGAQSELLGGRPMEAFIWVVDRPDLGKHGDHDGDLPGRAPDDPRRAHTRPPGSTARAAGRPSATSRGRC